jgi:hypothetical protein
MAWVRWGEEETLSEFQQRTKYAHIEASGPESHAKWGIKRIRKGHITSLPFQFTTTAANFKIFLNLSNPINYYKYHRISILKPAVSECSVRFSQ